MITPRKSNREYSANQGLRSSKNTPGAGRATENVFEETEDLRECQSN